MKKRKKERKNKQYWYAINLFFLSVFSCVEIKAQLGNNNAYSPSNQYFKSIYNSNTDVTYFCPLGELGASYAYVFSTELNPNLFIFEKKESPLALCFTATGKVRMRSNSNLGDRSFAVRTPSYHVKGRAFYALPSKKNTHYQYAELWGAHHSNGQDGYTTLADGKINTYNGSFGTNYLYLSYVSGKFGNDAEKVWSAGLEWHPLFIYHDMLLKENYGFTRLHFNATYKRKRDFESDLFEKRPFLEHWRVHFKWNYAINRMKDSNLGEWKRRMNTEVSFNYLFHPESKAGMYLAVGYYGEDPYNIFFLNRYAFARFGLSVMF